MIVSVASSVNIEAVGTEKNMLGVIYEITKSDFSVMGLRLKLFAVVILLSLVSAVAQTSLITWFVKQSSQKYFCPTNEVVFLENGYFSGMQCASSCSRSPTCIAFVYKPETLICIGCASEFEISAGNPVSMQHFRQFRIVKKETNWTDAKTGCEVLGGQLAIINSEDEQKSVNEILTAIVYSKIWIGGNDIDEEGTFVWVDGSLVSDGFEFWIASIPNEHSPTQDCIVLHSSQQGNTNIWGDAYCNSKFWSICEFN